jgi:hypothetical protein
MALLGQSPDIIPEGFTQLLLATLQCPGVVESHIRALEVTSQDLLEALPTIDRVPRQVVQLGPGRVD